MRETIAFRIDGSKKRRFEELADEFETTTSAVTAGVVKAGLDATLESEKSANDFLAEYLDDREVGRPRDDA